MNDGEAAHFAPDQPLGVVIWPRASQLAIKPTVDFYALETLGGVVETRGSR